MEDSGTLNRAKQLNLVNKALMACISKKLEDSAENIVDYGGSAQEASTGENSNDSAEFHSMIFRGCSQPVSYDSA